MVDKNNSDFINILENELFPFVEKPSRYIGNELHSIKKDLNRIKLHGILCFPELYDIGMSHYGSQILYHIVNKVESWALSRCYHPWSDAEEIMRNKNIPLYSLEYFSPLSQADWLGFSIQYELQYTNFINMLDLAGIPQLSKQRSESDPIIVVGGPCMGNVEPIADFIDVGVIGDGEEAIIELCEVLEKMKKENISKTKILMELSNTEYFYIPQKFKQHTNGIYVIADIKHQIKAAKIKSLTEDKCPTKQLVPLMEIVHSRLAVEVMRGCTRGCRFCSAGIYYRPVRERLTSSIIDQIKMGMELSGWNDVSLLSLSTADYSCFSSLISELYNIRQESLLKVSLPSTRIDGLTNKQVQVFNEITPSSSFTLAPEAGSQRMRNVINKNFTEESILEIIKILLENNIQTLKLYFMIGLPTETDSDIDAIIMLIEKISNLVKAKSKKRMVHVSISPFSPKAHTPFQWEAMDSIQVLLEKSLFIKKKLRYKKNVKISYRNPEITFLETVMARGDRKISAVIQKAWEKGARNDGWDEKFNLERWQEAAKEVGVCLDQYTNEIPVEQTLPWSGISLGVTEEFLLNERGRSLKGLITGDCRDGNCENCGICNSKQSSDLIKKMEIPIPLDSTPSSQKKIKDLNKVKRVFYRIEYTKSREVRFLGHKDIVETFHRAFKAAKIPVAFSQGYHPHPRMAFGPPLGLGIMGKSEFFDVTLKEDIGLTPTMFDPWLPKGLFVKKTKLLKAKPDSLNASIIAGVYSFEPLITMDINYVRTVLDGIKEMGELIVTINKKGKEIKKDIKPLIYSTKLITENNTWYIGTFLSMIPSKTCRPLDFITGVFPDYKFADFLITRTACICLKGDKYKNIGDDDFILKPLELK